MLGLATDPIPNIRFNVAKSLDTISGTLKQPQLAPLVNTRIKPALTRLSAEDTDGDVRYFASKALSALV
jgi:serine/threonine-protein phosphatase 2A regulatory subunit A